MLSLESIERRLEDPKAYYIFYSLFYKAAIGEAGWKECMDDTSEEAPRIGNNTTEAFALLLFANNYRAWLYEMKCHHVDTLWTEYDTVPGEGKQSIREGYVPNKELVLEEEATESVVCDHTTQTYKTAAKATRDWSVAFRRKPICIEMKRTWEENVENDEPAVNMKERQAKRRKLMKGLKKFTGTASAGQRKFKGWSDGGHIAMEMTTKKIKADVDSGKYAIWEKAFREATYIRQQETKELAPVEKYVVNKSVVWEAL
jgi:hypothetical protein